MPLFQSESSPNEASDGLPLRMMPLQPANASQGSSGCRISASTLAARRTLVAMRWAYWPPKSMTAMTSWFMVRPVVLKAGAAGPPRGTGR